MKRALATIAKWLLFLLLYAVGSFAFHPFHLQTALPAAAGDPSGAPRSFVWDGVLLMVFAGILLFVVEAARKRLASSTPWTALALLLAGLTGYLLKFGFITYQS